VFFVLVSCAITVGCAISPRRYPQMCHIQRPDELRLKTTAMPSKADPAGAELGILSLAECTVAVGRAARCVKVCLLWRQGGIAQKEFLGEQGAWAQASA
jgi:hypothetical protein